MKKLIFFLFLVVRFWPAFAQQPQLLQERNYLVKANNTDILASTQDKQGNVYYSGITWAGIAKWDNFFLKVKPNVDTLWTRKSPVQLEYPILTLQTLPKDGIITGGNFGSQQTVMSIQRVNSVGSGVWLKNFNVIRSVITTTLTFPNNDLLLGGAYGKTFSFTRTDSLGNVKWSKAYPWGMFNEGLMDMKFSKIGNIIAVGITESPVGPAHLKLLLVNQNGDSLLGRQLVVTDSVRTESMYYNHNSVTPLTNGGYLITANVDTITASAPGGTNMGMVVKVDANLHYQWRYIHRTPAVDEYVFTKAKELADGTVLVLGYKLRPLNGTNLNGFQIYRFSPHGQLLNVYPFTSSICAQVSGVTFDALSDSTYLIGGGCDNNAPVSSGFYVAKVKIPGLSLPLPPVAISGTNEELLAGTGLVQSYPNPTAAEAIIPYNLPNNYRKASIIIREIATGREIRKYDLKRKESRLKVDLSNFSNGLYLYSLEVDDKPVATKKLVVMK